MLALQLSRRRGASGVMLRDTAYRKPQRWDGAEVGFWECRLWSAKVSGWKLMHLAETWMYDTLLAEPCLPKFWNDVKCSVEEIQISYLRRAQYAPGRSTMRPPEALPPGNDTSSVDTFSTNQRNERFPPSFVRISRQGRFHTNCWGRFWYSVFVWDPELKRIKSPLKN